MPARCELSEVLAGVAGPGGQREGPHMGLVSSGPGHPHRRLVGPQAIDKTEYLQSRMVLISLSSSRALVDSVYAIGPTDSMSWSVEHPYRRSVGPDVPRASRVSGVEVPFLVFVAVPARQGVGVDLVCRLMSATHIVVSSDQMPVRGCRWPSRRSMSLSSVAGFGGQRCRRRACRRSESATHIVVSLDHMPAGASVARGDQRVEVLHRLPLA